MTFEQLLLAAVEQRLLRPLDVQFALMVAQNDPPAVKLAAALLSRDAGEGHVCLPLSRLSGDEALSGKERFAEDGFDRLDARKVKGVVALQVAQLGRNIDDVACGGTVAKVDQDRRSDLGLVGKGLRNAVSERFGQRTGGDIENHARVGGNGLRCRIGLGLRTR